MARRKASENPEPAHPAAGSGAVRLADGPVESPITGANGSGAPRQDVSRQDVSYAASPDPAESRSAEVGDVVDVAPEPAAAATDSSQAEAAPEAAMPALPVDVTDEELARVASALVFASHRPLSISRLSELLGQAPGRIRAALAVLDEKLRSAGAPFVLTDIAGGLRYMTGESVAKYVSALRGEQKKERLSAAALETLAIVAYRQPVTKGEIEAMRGVQAGPMLRMLLEKRLIKIMGRAPVPGRPLQYGTTKEFLDKFNLASLKDLPTSEELSKP
jgi:segregation and condensation protein B